MGNPWTTRFDSSSSSSSSTRSSSPGDEKKEEDGTKRKKKSKFFMDPATHHNHSSSAFERHLATMGTRAWTCFTFIKGVRIKRKEKLFQQNGGFLLQHVSYLRAKSFKIFTAKELEIATENYSVSRIVGQGGYGVVYKGTLPDNTTVAIKKSRIVDAIHIELFINEIDILSQINHRNVVKLLGCCLEDQDLLLVYEFISNGTLHTHIHQTGHIQSISLQNRLRIATEIAEAVAYLHSGASIQIFHRDVKPSNILLDDNLTAKVSDFGISRLVPIDQTQLDTCIVGTLGYLDPEYFQTNQLTAKSDVYSFGVLLVELLTAKKSVLRLSRSQEHILLATHFLSAMKENRLLQVLDDQVRNVGHESQVTAIAQLAKRCLEVKGEERPTMKEVMVELLGLRGSQYHPCVNNNIEEVESLLGERAETLEMTQPTTPKGKGKKKPETEGIGVGKETDESSRTWIHENALLDHIERSSVRVDRKKIKNFRDSFDFAFDRVGRESCSTSQLDIESTKDTPSSQRKRVVEKGRHSKKFKPTAKKLDYSDEPIQVDSATTSPRPSATFSHPVSPFVDDVLNTPFNTPPEMSIVVHTPMSDINRLIWQIKRLHRERKIPQYFEEYAHPLVQSEYVLTELEITLLEGFLGFYKTKLDELEIYCTMVAPKDLKNALDLETWLDTNLMYWWFDILKDRYPDVIFYDSSICSWWQENNIKALEDNVWGKDGNKVWEAKQKRLLVFIIWHEAHFTLLVGDTQERRWDFYNSMKSDRSSLTACKEFIDFLGKQFSNYGWYDAHVWPLLVKTEIPYQENGNDCGVFALAFADHCASGRPINFTQVDIPYWRSKIVVDIYKRSWEINSHRLPINPFLS